MKFFQSILSYFRDAIAELQKVVWPSKEDLTRYTILIVTVSVIAAIFFGVLDNVLNTGVRALINRTQNTNVPSAPQNVTIPQDSLQVTGDAQTVDLTNPASPVVTSTVR